MYTIFFSQHALEVGRHRRAYGSKHSKQAYPQGEMWCGQVTLGYVLRIIKAWKALPRMIEKRNAGISMWLSINLLSSQNKIH